MIRVGFHSEAQVLVIEGHQVFPARSLTVHDDGDGFLELWSLAGRSERRGHWQDFGSLTDETFASHAETVAYLEGEFAKPIAAIKTADTYRARRDLGGHRVVAMTTSGGLDYASSDDPASAATAVGLTENAVEAGAVTRIVASGPIDEPSWSFVCGSVYLGVNGILTQEAPTAGYVLRVGKALSPTRLLVDLDEPYFLAA